MQKKRNNIECGDNKGKRVFNKINKFVLTTMTCGCFSFGADHQVSDLILNRFPNLFVNHNIDLQNCLSKLKLIKRIKNCKTPIIIFTF